MCIANSQQLLLQIIRAHVCCIDAPQVRNLSGGELRRVAIALCLGKPADIYLIDEPSAYLDSEQRIHASKVGCCATAPCLYAAFSSD